MSEKGNERLNPRIDRKLARLARSSPSPPGWHEAWSRLGPGSTLEERLKVRQAVRDSGDVPADAGYFLVCHGAEALAAEIEEKLRDPLQMLNVFEARKTSDRILADVLERHGEAGMAALVRGDPVEHARRREAGRLFFFGPVRDKAAEAGWLTSLLRVVADGLLAPQPVETLEYWHRPEGDDSEVHVRRPAAGGWAFDAERLRESFDRVDAAGWYAAPAAEEAAPYFWMEGRFLDRDVFLRVMPNAPHPAEPGERYEVWRRG
jgi:hypothetical protein